MFVLPGCNGVIKVGGVPDQIHVGLEKLLPPIIPTEIAGKIVRRLVGLGARSTRLAGSIRERAMPRSAAKSSSPIANSIARRNPP